MAILFADHSYRAQTIFARLKQHMPGIDLRFYPETGNPAEIDYAIVFRPEPNALQNLPNLKAVFTIGAGVDAIILDKTLPDVPLIRNADRSLTNGVAEYVVYHVLRYHRGFHIMEQQQRDKIWKQHAQIKAQDRIIGIMGLGEIGTRCAEILRGLGFSLRGWSRTQKNIPDMTCFAGNDALPDFLAEVSILVNVLPLTDQTRGILNADLFARLPQGAFLINAGRGAHQEENDLLQALVSGQIAAASLDVFATEPLPPEHPFWSQPQITLTPHIASLTDYGALAHNILEQIQQFEAGQPWSHVVDRKRQY